MKTLTRRATKIQCAVCSTLAPCPVCAKNEMCQLNIPPTCAQCAQNTCVINPAYGHGHPSAGSVGGAVGGVLAALALAGVLFLFWRKRHQRAKAAVRRARAEAKVRMASEKFRPGGGAKGRLLAGGATGDIKDPGTAVDFGKDPFDDFARSRDDDVEEEDNNSADVEWTELREDGLTTFRNKPGQNGKTESDAAMFKRHSVGAATHLSRITEGAEDEEEQDENARKHRSLNIRETIIEEPEMLNSTQAGTRGHTSSASIGSEQNQARSRRSYVGREQSNPFADWSDVGSLLSAQSSSAGPLSTEGSTAICSSALEHSKWSSPIAALEPPSRAHRAVGAPIVDLQGKPKSGQRSPATRTIVLPPSRPNRLPDLNLRLEDGVEPGKVGDDLRKPRVPLGLTNGNASGSNSPISPSSPRLTQEANDKTQFRSMDSVEVRELQDFPSELAKSDVYHKPAGGNRISAMTTKSSDTLDTLGTFEYVMSAPQIVTPLAADGAKRMQLKQGKAQLVRSLSAVRREQEQKKAMRSTVSTSTHGDEANDPFSDVNSAYGLVAPSSSARSMGSTDSDQVKTGDSLSPYTQRILSKSGISIEMQSRPHSGVSEASLPFVDRPIREPTDRSPTDANPRGSMATIGSQASLPRFHSSLSDVGLSPQNKHDSNASSLLSVNVGGAANPGRHSGASIGGLSVLDEIPFHIGGNETDTAGGQNGMGQDHVQIAMPDEAQQFKAHRPTSAASSAVTVEIVAAPRSNVISPTSSTFSGNPLLHNLQGLNAAGFSTETGGSTDEQPQHSPFHDDHAPDVQDRHLSLNTQKSVEARRTSVPSSLAEADDVQLDMVDDGGEDETAEGEGSTAAGRPPAGNRLATNPNFDQIRLRHELDNYPFANDP